jgi:hypothetical protein
MKTTPITLFCVFSIALAFRALGADTNFPVTISWKQTITNTVPFTEFPSIMYRVSGSIVTTQALVVARFSQRGSTGEIETHDATDYRPRALVEKSGEFEMRPWGNMTRVLFITAGRLSGSGTIRIALYEAQKDTDPNHKGQYRAGRQLSDWIELSASLDQ